MIAMKLKLLTEDDDDNKFWRDFYIDAEYISAFFIPMKENDDEEDSINIYMNGDMFSVKTEEHIKDFLYDRFVKPIQTP